MSWFALLATTFITLWWPWTWWWRARLSTWPLWWHTSRHTWPFLLRFHGSIPFPLNISDPTMDLLLELQHAGMFSYKYLHQNLQKFDKSYKDLVWHIFCWQYVGGEVLLLIQKCKLWPTAWDAIPHIYHIWGMVTKYCQYEVLNFADKLHIQYIPFKLLSVSDTAEYIQKTLWMMRNQTIRHREINKMHDVKNWQTKQRYKVDKDI